MRALSAAVAVAASVLLSPGAAFTARAQAATKPAALLARLRGAGRRRRKEPYVPPHLASVGTTDTYVTYTPQPEVLDSISLERQAELLQGAQAKSDMEWAFQLRKWQLQPVDEAVSQGRRALWPYQWLPAAPESQYVNMSDAGRIVPKQPPFGIDLMPGWYPSDLKGWGAKEAYVEWQDHGFDTARNKEMLPMFDGWGRPMSNPEKNRPYTGHVHLSQEELQEELVRRRPLHAEVQGLTA